MTVAFEEKYTFNVAVSELMILSNHLRDSAAVMCTAEYHRALSTLFTMLAPMAPHIACQLWEGHVTYELSVCLSVCLFVCHMY